MSTFKVKKMFSAVVVSAWLGLVVLFVGHGCSEIGSPGGKRNGAASLGVDVPDGITIYPNTKTVSTVYAKQFLDNMVSCTGLRIESAETRERWEAESGSLSEFGYATDVTPPMMMAIATVAGEICSDITNPDATVNKGSRDRLFPGVNFASNGTMSSGEIRDAVQRVALSCWHRRASSDEVNVISSMVTDNVASETTNRSQMAAMLVCTSMLSSYKSIEM